MSSSDHLKEIAREATNLYRPIWMIKDYAVSSSPIKQDFMIIPMVCQLVCEGKFFIVQDAHTFEIDRMSAMNLIDEELDLSCLLGKMNNLFSAYADILGDEANDTSLDGVDTGMSECDGFKEKYGWFGAGGSSYFTSLEEAERYVAEKIAKALGGENDIRLLDCAPFDIRNEHPELLI